MRDLTRRQLIRRATIPLALITLPGAASRLLARPLQSAFETVAEEKWARIVRLRDGVWAVISTPLGGSFETICNGGIVAGEERVLAFDAYGRGPGAQWVSQQCTELTGRPPTDIVISHHHGDHTAGLAGFAGDGARPRVHLTQLVKDQLTVTDVAAEMIADAKIVSADGESSLDLGGNVVRLQPMRGHTKSDLVAHAGDVAFCGDLVWNELFPNYMDATPSQLRDTVAQLIQDQPAVAVPGHGSLPEAADLERYAQLLGEIEAAAKKAYEAGRTAEEAGGAYSIPESLGSWTLFNPRYFVVAFEAWHRELAA